MILLYEMVICVEYSDDVAFWKVGEVSRRARPGMKQITGPVVREKELGPRSVGFGGIPGVEEFGNNSSS